MKNNINKETYRRYKNYNHEFILLKYHLKSKYNVYNITARYILLTILAIFISFLEPYIPILAIYIIFVNLLYIYENATNEKRIIRKLNHKYRDIDVDVDTLSTDIKEYEIKVTKEKKFMKRKEKRKVEPLTEELANFFKYLASEDEEEFELKPVDPKLTLKNTIRNDINDNR